MTRDGGYAEYVTLRTEAVVKVPSDVDAAEYGKLRQCSSSREHRQKNQFNFTNCVAAPILCAGITVWNSMRKQNVRAGELVAISGIGGLGHLAIQYAHKLGFRVAAMSTSDNKEKFAKELGADHFINVKKEDACKALQKLGGAALIIATAPNPDAISPLTGGLQVGGKLLVLAPSGELKINSVDLIMKGAGVVGWPSGHALDSEEAIEFTRLKGVKCMIEKFPLEKAQEAFDHMMSGDVRFRSVLVME